MEANIGHLPTKFGYKQMQGWKVINRYSLAGKPSHLTFDLLMWPLTPEYHGSQHRASTNQVWLQTNAGLESYSSFCKRHGRTEDRRTQCASPLHLGGLDKNENTVQNFNFCIFVHTCMYGNMCACFIVSFSFPFIKIINYFTVLCLEKESLQS